METRLITIATLSYVRAQMLKSRLDSEGIGCNLLDENGLPSFLTDNFDVQVAEEEAVKAIHILKEMGFEDIIAPVKEELLGNITRILVPIDFSEASRNACIYAIGIASRIGANIKLLYTYYIPEVRSMPYEDNLAFDANLADYIGDLKSKAEQDIEELLTYLKEQLRKEKITNVSIVYSLETGFIEEAIGMAVATFNPDMLIMGTPPKKERSSYLLGEITTKVISWVNIPVLIIPANCVYDGVDKFKSLMNIVDLNESDFFAIKRLVRLVAPFNMDIKFVHIGHLESKPLSEDRLSKIKEYFSRISGVTSISCDLIDNEDVLNAVQSYIGEKQISLLSINAHRRGLLERLFTPNIPKKLVKQTEIPLLVFHT